MHSSPCHFILLTYRGTHHYLTIFNTHKGRYWSLHMAHSLRMNQDVLQMHIDQIADRLPCILAIHSDFCVYGHTLEEHERHFLQLMKLVMKNSLVSNSSKCRIREKKSASMVQSLYPEAWNLIPLEYTPCKISPHPTSRLNYNNS